MQNQDNNEQKIFSAENLDTSQMSGAEVLEAVGMSDKASNSVLPADSGNTAMPEPVSDIQKRIAEIQQQKMAKIREALAAQQAQEPSESVSSNPPIEENTSEKRTVSVKKANSKSTADTIVIPKQTASSAVAVAERPAPEPVEFPEVPSEETAPAEEEAEEQNTVPENTASAKPRKKRKKRNSASGAKMGMLIGAGFSGALLAAYFIGAVSFNGKFLPRTYINSLSVAGMTTEEAHDALIEAKELKDLTLITHKGEQIVFSAADFKAAYVLPAGALNEASSEGNFNWISKLFKSSEYAVRYDYTYSEDDLRNLIQTYDWGSEVSQNAKIVRNNKGKFEIQPETLGDKFDTAILLDYVSEQLSKGKNTVNMEESGCYEKYRAKVKSVDLEDDVEVYNRYSNCTITFDFDDRKKQVDNDMIVSWFLTKDDGSFITTSGHEIPLNQDAIAEFVAQMADETDTYGKEHEFYATLDGWITLEWTKYSNYGWLIDQNATVNQIIELINAGEPVIVEPIYSEKGYTRQTDDIGTTYIEADISAQHAWYYRDNELVMDFDFVSGKETDPNRRTPRGINKITHHINGITLGTYAVQGYEQWVDYWMKFNDFGCGFHDLSRGSYGGSVYMYNGSHGCLNMRRSDAKKLFEETEVGIPVLIHD